MADFNDLLKKKSLKTDTNKDSGDLKERMRNVVNASRKLSDGDENTISNQKQEDIKARLAKAMEASKQVEEMYAEEFDKDEEKRKEAEKEERKKKLEEQQKKAVEKLAQIEKAEEEDNNVKIEEPKIKKDLSELTKKDNTVKQENIVEASAEPQVIIKEVIKEVPVEVIKEVVKEVPVEVIKYVEITKEEKEGLDEAFESGEEEIIETTEEENAEENVEENVDTTVDEVVEIKEALEEKEVIEEPKKEKKPSVVLEFFTKTMNGMAYGLFATLIIGTILDTIANIGFIKNVDYIYQFLTALAVFLKNSMGIGIGIGIAYNMGFKDLKLISLGIAGGVASYMCGNALEFFNFEACAFKVGDPLTIYITLALTGLAVKYVFSKKTSIDIIIIPLFAGIIAGLISFASSPAIIFVTTAIGNYIEIATTYQPFLMGIVIAVIMGMCLTAPISSAAIAAVVLTNAPLAGGAAVVGCCVQMLGFAVQTARDNKIGSVISVGIGTSMLQFKNILRKPIIWLPTIIASAILGPIATCVFKTHCVGVSAGMGTSGLVGIIGTISSMEGGMDMILSIAVLEVAAPIVLVFLIDLLFRALKLIKKGDFEL